jgi:low temperature requirement protein LtrA
MGSSSYWKVLSFKRTHLVERLGLLTLIIIGEGVIVMLKAVNAVEKGQTYGRGWTASIFFIVAAAVGILVSDYPYLWHQPQF